MRAKRVRGCGPEGSRYPCVQRDADVAACAICEAEFKLLLRRRHHCRCCGMITCDKCSSSRMPILSYGVRPRALLHADSGVVAP
jgi:hypothetical protein